MWSSGVTICYALMCWPKASTSYCDPSGLLTPMWMDRCPILCALIHIYGGCHWHKSHTAADVNCCILHASIPGGHFCGLCFRSLKGNIPLQIPKCTYVNIKGIYLCIRSVLGLCVLHYFLPFPHRMWCPQNYAEDSISYCYTPSFLLGVISGRVPPKQIVPFPLRPSTVW